MIAPIRGFEDLREGQAFDLPGFSLSEREVLDFAARYDPQPFHTDPEAARRSIFGELVASGFQTLAASFAAVITSGLLGEANLGGNAIELRWPAPLPPDVPVSLRLEVAELRTSRSRPEMGIAKLRYIVARQDTGAVVLDALTTHFLRRVTTAPG